MKFPRYNGKSGAAIESVSYSSSYNAQSGQAQARIGGGHDNEGFVASHNALNESNGGSGGGGAPGSGKLPLSRLPSDPETMRMTQKLAVDVDRLRVTYGYGRRASEVLKGIDLTLPEGKM
ncbi:ABC transporter G family member 20-like [Tropilaelaps mercedesae]|uniref:ABC transporter G family member 20-like n=1 Tax=Tropilaelaps mercedesae TaxID=418985 RepID=A0A1V9XIH1_9ACAR|nr:ABC transporter G family member 20-like [Tropilaelaps mercedesae]